MVEMQESTLNDYLRGNELNVLIYQGLKKDHPKLFPSYLEFFNVLYQWYDFFEKHQDDYYYFETEFDKIEIPGLQLHAFLTYLVTAITYYNYSERDQGVLLSPVGRQSFNYIEEKLSEIDEKLFPKAEIIKVPEPTAPIHQQSSTYALEEHNNSQTVLIFYYFFKAIGINIRNNIDFAPVAKFMHLITGKEFKATTSSDFYNKLRQAPNFKTNKELIRDLEDIKPLFEKVQLKEAVKAIDEEISRANEK